MISLFVIFFLQNKLMLAFQIYAASIVFFHVSEFTLAAFLNPRLLGWSCKFNVVCEPKGMGGVGVGGVEI